MEDRAWDEICDEEKQTSYAVWRTKGGGQFADKEELIRSYARHLLDSGEQATRERIDAMLAGTGRGYARSPSHVSRALRGWSDQSWGELASLKYPNSRPVIADGEPYRSIRAAAEAKRIAIETVRKRIKSGRPGWKYAD